MEVCPTPVCTQTGIGDFDTDVTLKKTCSTVSRPQKSLTDEKMGVDMEACPTPARQCQIRGQTRPTVARSGASVILKIRADGESFHSDLERNVVV
jgi:hypothetical protein